MGLKILFIILNMKIEEISMICYSPMINMIGDTDIKSDTVKIIRILPEL